MVSLLSSTRTAVRLRHHSVEDGVLINGLVALLVMR